MKKLSIYTDGACSGNPGPGGWGAILVCERPSARKEISGGTPQTTNNRMELTAAIEALSLLKEPCEILLTTDSRYLLDAFEKDWLGQWQRNGWKTAAKQPVKNRDLWEKLLELSVPHRLRWQWIRGHSDHPENERADELAVAAREAAAER